MYYIGIDVGGTFTDLALMDDSGRMRPFKTPTTPQDFTLGLMNGLQLAADELKVSLAELLGQVKYFGHGTTIGTNALIQRKGAKTGLITTGGFGDTIFIQRTMSLSAGLSDEEARHYSARRPTVPIIPRKLVKEVTERVDFSGAEVVPLDKEEAKTAVRELVGQGVEAIAICFLWSFMNPRHEQEMKEIVTAEAPKALVFASNELLPAIGEYERTSATAINAYLGPIIATYINVLSGKLRNAGLKSPICIMNSMGGVASAAEAAKTAVALISSGPSGGVLGSIFLGNMLGCDNIIVTDMGGTSFDVSVIAKGKPTISTISEVSKYHISLPMIDIASIGAGGGSIASVENGELKVGPNSAGARPGPACYNAGGVYPTVTDADMVLGVIDPAYFLGGRLKLSRERAEAAITEYVAKPLGIDLVSAAAGIKRIVDNHMADLLRAHTVKRGHDPAEFVLFAYGGAGPTHCSAYGTELNVKQIVVPVTATVHSAYGALASDMHLTLEMTDLMRTPAMAADPAKYLDAARIARNFESLEQRGAAALKNNGIASKDMSFERTLGMLYRRQAREIQVTAPWTKLGPEEMEKLIAEFEKVYETLYGKGTAYKDAGIEIRRFRVDAIGHLPKPSLKKYALGGADASAGRLGKRKVYFYEAGGFRPTDIYDGSRLKAGNAIKGPAVIQYPGTTVLVDENQGARIDEFLNCIIERR